MSDAPQSFCNVLRWRQAFDLQGAVFASGLTGPDWHVLCAVARRCSVNSGPNQGSNIPRITDSMFAAIATLAKDSALQYRRTKKSLDALCEKGFLRRTDISGSQVKRYFLSKFHFPAAATSAPATTKKPTSSAPAPTQQNRVGSRFAKSED